MIIYDNICLYKYIWGSLGFQFRVSLGLRLGLLGFYHGVNEGNSRHPSGEMDDIPNLRKHWPCAVKTHTTPGSTPVLAVNTYVYVLYVCM